ncbi:MAG: DUF2848 domain-containing protein [Nitrososphaeria archaeon]|nr:DUF2848 domain-containing protein [Nitrososphaeria archaeon]NIN53381.1 DUF2848 domain-containing protein [Nitrososphaeria archaeon]NIQ33847.1 DUF2848 domain-containing protein [Nitrososphaeria archaeon]
MKISLDVERERETERVDFDVMMLLCGGWSGRDRQEILRHAEELRHLGVEPPEKFPIIFPVSRYLLTGGDEVEVISTETSGEVEYVAFADRDVFISVGSDHTDRSIEGISIEKAKQSCPKVVAQKAWAYQDVKDHWDELVVKSYAYSQGKRLLYQEAALSSLITVETLLAHVDRERFGDKGLVLFSGTVPLLTKNFIYADEFEVEMSDPRLNRRMSHRYRVKVL